MINFPIILVSLFLIFYIHSCLGEPNPPLHPCQPPDPTKSKCLHGCLCAWCPLPNSTESSGIGELSEHNKNHGPLGKCFLYYDSSDKAKNCINGTIYTNYHSKYCRGVHTFIHVLVYVACIAGAIGLVIGTIMAFIYWWYSCK